MIWMLYFKRIIGTSNFTAQKRFPEQINLVGRDLMEVGGKGGSPDVVFTCEPLGQTDTNQNDVDQLLEVIKELLCDFTIAFV